MYVCVEVTYYLLVYTWTNSFTIQVTAYIHILTNDSEYSWGISPRVASMVAHVWFQSHTIISVSPARVSQLCFKKLFCSEIKLEMRAALESSQNTSGAINFE